ncbi:MAG: hypothetical protein GXO07_05515 [Crenarchaeota archaeon]|nr:hypothetical protein [Thermoproteota archaeon]
MYDYIVKENGKAYAVRLEERGSKVLDLVSGEEERGTPFREGDDVTEVGRVRFARVALYDALEAKGLKLSGKVFWLPHFLGPYVLAHDYMSGKLLSVDVLTARAETLAEDVATFLPFESNTCCGVEELRFVLVREGGGELYSFDRHGRLRMLRRVPYPFQGVTDEVALNCAWRCRFLTYTGDLVRIRDVFREYSVNAKYVDELEAVVVLGRDVDRSGIIRASDYELILIRDGSAVSESPYVPLDGDKEYALSGASQDYLLLHAVPEDGDSRFELYAMSDIINEVADLEPVSEFGLTSLPDEAVLIGDKVYLLTRGIPKVLEF